MQFRAVLIFTCLFFIEIVNSLVPKSNSSENVPVKRPKVNIEIDYNDSAAIKQMIEEIEREYGEIVEGKGRRYKPDWADLDTRPLPEWYDKAKIGIFLHWGVYSVPSFQSEWFWYFWHDGKEEYEKFMENNYPPGFTYQKFAHMFTAEFFEPDKFADLFVRAGAKYVVLTSKHHEGFALFPSKRSYSWNSVDVGPHRDLVGDLADAVRQVGLRFGVYHSLYEWFNPMYLADKEANYTTRTYVTYQLWPDIKQLVNDYKPSVLWSDGEWEADDTYWNATELLAWLYNDSPVRHEVVVNDRWGTNIRCQHGDFYNCEDRYNPGELQRHKWENAFTLDRQSWGYNRQMNLSNVLTTRELLREIISTISCGGNALINVGPTKEGTIAPIFEERLLELGEWLDINGDAIYNSSPWLYQKDALNGEIWYTCTMPWKSNVVTSVYVSFLDWPENNLLILADVTSLMRKQWSIEMLGNEGTDLKWKTLSSNLTAILLPRLDTVNSKYAWTLRFKPPKSAYPTNSTEEI